MAQKKVLITIRPYWSTAKLNKEGARWYLGLSCLSCVIPLKHLGYFQTAAQANAHLTELRLNAGLIVGYEPAEDEVATAGKPKYVGS